MEVSGYQDTLSGASLAVVSQRTVGDLTGLNLGSVLEIRERIGRGGMGSVYLAHHRDWDLSLAVKSPRPDLLTNDTDKERWLLEAQTWIDLGVHPNIVRCWFIREHEGIPLLFLDYVAGGSLKEALEQRRFGIANWPKFIDLAIQACDGLCHAHDSGIVHRDVKPANFLLDDEGRLYVTDFGLVKLQGRADVESPHQDLDLKEYDGGLTSTGTVLGTPNYCAPEQWLQGDVGASADLYAMGVVLYEMCVGQLPFEAGPGPLGLGQLLSKVLTEDPQPPRLLQPSIPESLESLILRLLAKDAQDRPETALALRQELVEIYETLGQGTYPRPIPKPVEAVVDVLNNKAVSLYSLGRKKPAEETWLEALRLDSLHPDVVYNRGFLLWRQGLNSAQELISTLRQVRLTYARSALHCGLSHLWGGEWEAAEQHLGEAVAQSETALDSSAWRFLGDARMGRERYAEAVVAYEMALTLNPRDASSRLYLEMAQKKTRRQGGRCLFPRHHPLLRMHRQHRLTHVVSVAGGWLWLGAEHMELLPADKARRSWSILHDVGLRKVLVSSSASRIVAIETLPAGTWALESGALIDTLDQGERYFALTADGIHAVAGLVELRRVELKSGKVDSVMRGHEKQVLCATFCGGSQKLLSGSCDRTARFWDVERGACLQVFQGHRDFVTCLAYSAETGLALSGSRDHSARCWRVDTGECFRILDEDGPISSVAFAGAGRFAVVQTQESGEYLTSVWDIRTAQLSRRLAGVSRVSPDGKFLLTARVAEGQTWLEVRDIFSGCLRREFHLEESVVSDICFATDGRFFAAVTLGGDFLLYEFDEDYRVLPEELLLTNTRGGQDLEENREKFLKHLRAAQESFERDQFLDSRGHLQQARSVGGYRRDPQARALTRQLGRHLGRGELLSCWEVRLLGSAGGSSPSPIVLIPGTDLMLTANEKILRLWNHQQGSCIRGFPGHSEPIRSIGVNTEGTRAVSGSLDRGVRCWDLQSGASLGRVSLSKGGAIALHWLPDTHKLVALTNQHALCGIDVEDFQETFQVPATGISWMLGLNKHNLVWLGGSIQPGLLQVVDGLNGKAVRKPSQWKLSAAAGGESALLASAAVLYGDNHYGITAGREGKIHLWDLVEGRHLAVLLNIEYEVSCLAISADGLCLAVGLENGWVQIWDLQKKLLCQIIEGPWGKLASLALSPDGCELHILGCDTILRTWEMEWELQEFVSQSNLTDTLPKGNLFSRLWKGWKK